MSREVSRIVLPLAVWVSYRLLCDLRPMSPGAAAVSVGVLDTDRDRVPYAQRRTHLVRAHFPHGQCSVAHIQLHAMIANAQTYAKSERIAQPDGGLIDVGIREHGDYSRVSYRSVREHLVPP